MILSIGWRLEKWLSDFGECIGVQAAGIVLLSCTNNASHDTLSSMSEAKSKTLKAILNSMSMLVVMLASLM
jgi:hypothetical protein